MTLDPLEKSKLIRRGSGFLVYIPKSVLEQTNVDLTKDLVVRRYPTKDKQVILRFSEINK